MKTIRSLLTLSALCLIALPIQAQDTTAVATDTVTTTVTSGNVLDVARAEGSFMTLVQAIEAAGLTEDLMGEGPFTVFAPTDDAFGELEEGAVEDLLKPENRDQLRELLSYHIVEGERFTASDLQSRASELSYQLQTMGGLLAVSSADEGVLIGGARIATADLEASNGIVHVMSNVITAPSMNDEIDNN